MELCSKVKSSYKQIYIMLSDQGGAQEHGRSPRRAGQVPGGDSQCGGDPAGVRRRLQGGHNDLLKNSKIALWSSFLKDQLIYRSWISDNLTQEAADEARRLEEELQAGDEPERPPVPPLLRDDCERFFQCLSKSVHVISLPSRSPLSKYFASISQELYTPIIGIFE